MGKEVERKFLVKNEFRHLAVHQVEIAQGYLSVDPERIVRVRIEGEKSILTIKSPDEKGTFSRKEWEIEIPVPEAREIIKICLPDIIYKTRYIVPYKDHRYEVDQFHGKHEGLVIAEIELDDENETIEKPGWLGEEVTGRPEYYNSNLI